MITETLEDVVTNIKVSDRGGRQRTINGAGWRQTVARGIPSTDWTNRTWDSVVWAALRACDISRYMMMMIMMVGWLL